VRERFAAIYTAALADILDARGLHAQTLPPAIRPLERGTRVAGPAYTVKGGPAANPDQAAYDVAIRKVLSMLGDVPDGHVAVYACDQDVAAHLGELSVTSLKARGVAGCVLDGGCRDIGFIREEGFPVFCRFVTPEDSTWRWELEATQVPVSIGRVRIEPGDWVVGDDDGVVVVPQAIAEGVLAEAEQKAATESEIRVAVREGVPPLEAYERFGTF
jgi:4-hydroxy-4-methyl-2-oxoglutarate aldolase